MKRYLFTQVNCTENPSKALVGSLRISWRLDVFKGLRQWGYWSLQSPQDTFVAPVSVALVFDAPTSLQSRLQIFPVVRGRRTSRIFKWCSFGSSPSQSNPKKLGGVIDKEFLCMWTQASWPFKMPDKNFWIKCLQEDGGTSNLLWQKSSIQSSGYKEAQN